MTVVPGAGGEAQFPSHEKFQQLLKKFLSKPEQKAKFSHLAKIPKWQFSVLFEPKKNGEELMLLHEMDAISPGLVLLK